MTKNEKVANIMCFLSIIFGEDDCFSNVILKKSPDYLIEKFERYVESTRVEYPWGMHPYLRDRCFQRYVDEWHLELDDSRE